MFNIEYKHIKGCATPAVCIDEYSNNKGEFEYVFPPFSFFKIVKVELFGGSPDNPHIIYLEACKKKGLVEKGLLEGNTIKYDSDTNTIYY